MHQDVYKNSAIFSINPSGYQKLHVLIVCPITTSYSTLLINNFNLSLRKCQLNARNDYKTLPSDSILLGGHEKKTIKEYKIAQLQHHCYSGIMLLQQP